MDDSNASNQDVDALSGIATTGHEWDGIKELNNPLPRWWLWTFYATIVFAIGYVIYYPAIPLISTTTSGISGVTNRQMVEEELAAVAATQGVRLEKIAATPIQELTGDHELYRFVIAGGQSNFKVYCSQCHGSGAQGAPGYPNLNDDDWLWGGDLTSLYATIAHGVRQEENDNTRTSEMPAFGRDDILPSSQIRDVTEYVLKLSNRDHDASRAAAGQTVFAENCASCHGVQGRGGREFGAPNLADALSLYGGTREKLLLQIQSPQHGVMPAWIDKLGDARVKQLAVYVHSLGGGEQPKPKGE